MEISENIISYTLNTLGIAEWILLFIIAFIESLCSSHVLSALSTLLLIFIVTLITVYYLMSWETESQEE